MDEMIREAGREIDAGTPETAEIQGSAPSADMQTGESAIAKTGKTAPKKRRRAVPGWAIVIITIACVIVIGFGVLAALVLQGAGFFSGSESKAFAGPARPYIAKISIVGEIGGSASRYYSSDSAYHHAWTLGTIDTLIADENNRGIYLWINTPGGAVYESDELYLKLMEYREKTERPVYVYMGKMATSGGYYIASAADGIYANRNTWTGSIGVTMGTFFDVSEFLDKHGVHTDTITAGRNKAMGSYYEPLTDEQKKIYQGLVDDAYDRFVAIVAKGRGLSEGDVRKLADGRIYTAGQALETGLIDGILGEKEAEDAIKGKFEDGIVISECYYKADTNYLSLFGSFAGGGTGFWDLLRGGAGNAAPGGGDSGYSGGSGYSGYSGSAEGAAYEGDVAAVLDLAREQAEAGPPPLKYLYTG